jgi:hypothetical protein
MTLEIAEDGEPLGLLSLREITTSVDIAQVMPLLWIMC